MTTKLLLYDTANPEKPALLDFGVLAGTAAPLVGQGVNGDYYFQTNNGTESIYKKSSGAWNQIGGGASHVDEYFDVAGAPQAIFTIAQNFEVGSKLDVYQNGQEIKEYTGGGAIPAGEWKRNAGANTLETGTSVPINGRLKVRVF